MLIEQVVLNESGHVFRGANISINVRWTLICREKYISYILLPKIITPVFQYSFLFFEKNSEMYT